LAAYVVISIRSIGGWRMLRMVDAPNERGRTHHRHYSYFAVVGISIFDTRIV
jgi:hypothetical protein